MTDTTYTERRHAASRFEPLRGLSHHLLHWGEPALATPGRPPLVMLHGWMDIGASFQFVVDALDAEGDAPRWIVAPDWRGFGLTDRPDADAYWFPDYLADLDALLERLAPGLPVDLLGHSMGGNVAMLYAGVRPERVRRLVSLEGYGLPATRPSQAPSRYARWLDELRRPAQMSRYPDAAGVAARLVQTNPLLRPERAAWLARRWAREAPDGQWEILADPAHKRVHPILYRVDEVLACWERIAAPLLWVEGDRSRIEQYWNGQYDRAEFERRIAFVPRVERVTLPEAGHMLHHDQPEALAGHLRRFLDAA